MKKGCANGLVGYTIDKGHSYHPNKSCKREAVLGHILCEPCRIEGGGVPKVVVVVTKRNEE